MKQGKKLNELDVLKDVVKKLDASGVQYMLTGSMAMTFYSQPRMTRDIDIVALIKDENIDSIISAFEGEYYISKDAIKDATRRSSMFNIIHNDAAMKVDFIVRKNNEYRIKEFERRKKMNMLGFEFYVVSKEDLILSKMFWAKDTNSELQHRDIENLVLSGNIDRQYIVQWAKELGLDKVWEKYDHE